MKINQIINNLKNNNKYAIITLNNKNQFTCMKFETNQFWEDVLSQFINTNELLNNNMVNIDSIRNEM